MDNSSAVTSAKTTALAEIRDAAWDYLDGTDPSFDLAAAQARIAALDLTEEEKEQPAAHEAEVCLILASDAPGKRASKPLYNLFRNRMARREGEAFEAFQEGLRILEARGVSLRGLSLVQYFGNVDHAPVWSKLEETVREVEALVGPVFLNSGTLLGVVREQGFLLHDDDVDLAVVLSADCAEGAAQEWARTYHLLHEKQLLKQEVTRNQGVFKLAGGIGMNIDLFPAWVEEGRAWVYPHTAGTLSRDQMLPLAVCPFTRLPIPRDSGAMLASNYGDGWRTPDPGYKFRWNRANKRFQRFRDALVSDPSVWDL